MRPIAPDYPDLTFMRAGRGVGILFGSYPARRAAMMDPIEALPHE